MTHFTLLVKLLKILESNFYYESVKFTLIEVKMKANAEGVL